MLEVGVYVFGRGGRHHDSSLSSVTRGANKSNTKLSLVELCGSVLCGCGRAFIFFYLEARHHLVYNGVGVVEAEFIDSTSYFLEFKVSFAEVVLEVVPIFVCLVCVSTFIYHL